MLCEDYDERTARDWTWGMGKHRRRVPTPVAVHGECGCDGSGRPKRDGSVFTGLENLDSTFWEEESAVALWA